MKTTILFILLTFISCSKDKTPQEQLPPATQIGANTAGCYINGELLLPKNGSQAIGGPPAYGMGLVTGGNFYPNKNDYWQLTIANKRDINSSGVILYIKNMQNGNGDYIIDQSNGELYSDGPPNNQIIAGITKNGVIKTYYSSANCGIIKVTRSDLFYGTAIFSGTFNCTLYNKDNSSEIIQIVDGRFDINGISLNQ